MIPSDQPSSASGRRARVYGVIACQGDSLTFGSRDPDAMSYPLYLGRMLSERPHQTWVTVNLAVPADGRAEIWRRNHKERRALPDAGRGRHWARTHGPAKEV